ncbi:hypothetical protein [Thalassospira tepidiphila]|uniref:hypothetical protein n=1 Tax=Thalassospira tepidiphila TaxID=393657 RepID=UPI003AA7AB52
MPQNFYAQLTSQAWTQYQTVSTRGQNYFKLLEPHYKAFYSAAQKVDVSSDGLSTPPTETELDNFANGIALAQSGLAGINIVFSKFESMDKSLVASTATISQKSVESKNEENQEYDHVLQRSLNSVIYRMQLECSEGFFEANPQPDSEPADGL